MLPLLCALRVPCRTARCHSLLLLSCRNKHEQAVVEAAITKKYPAERHRWEQWNESRGFRIGPTKGPDGQVTYKHDGADLVVDNSRYVIDGELQVPFQITGPGEKSLCKAAEFMEFCICCPNEDGTIPSPSKIQKVGKPRMRIVLPGSIFTDHTTWANPE